MLQRFNSVLLHDTLPVDLPDPWPSDVLILAFLFLILGIFTTWGIKTVIINSAIRSVVRNVVALWSESDCADNPRRFCCSLCRFFFLFGIMRTRLLPAFGSCIQCRCWNVVIDMHIAAVATFRGLYVVFNFSPCISKYRPMSVVIVFVVIFIFTLFSFCQPVSHSE